jgi:hypothetical protein
MFRRGLGIGLLVSCLSGFGAHSDVISKPVTRCDFSITDVLLRVDLTHDQANDYYRRARSPRLNRQQRVHALRMLGSARDLNGTGGLIQLLQDEESPIFIRAAAARFLGATQSPFSILPLQSFLDSRAPGEDIPEITAGALLALGHLKDWYGVARIVRYLAHPNVRVVCAAAKALSRIQHPDTVPALIKVLDNSGISAGCAADALGKFPKENFGADLFGRMIQANRSGDVSLASTIAVAMAERGEVRLSGYLSLVNLVSYDISALRSEDSRLASAKLNFMIAETYLGSTGHISELLQQLAVSNSPYVSFHIIGALERLPMRVRLPISYSWENPEWLVQFFANRGLYFDDIDAYLTYRRIRAINKYRRANSL